MTLAVSNPQGQCAEEGKHRGTQQENATGEHREHNVHDIGNTAKHKHPSGKHRGTQGQCAGEGEHWHPTIPKLEEEELKGKLHS